MSELDETSGRLSLIKKYSPPSMSMSDSQPFDAAPTSPAQITSPTVEASKNRLKNLMQSATMDLPVIAEDPNEEVKNLPQLMMTP